MPRQSAPSNETRCSTADGLAAALAVCRARGAQVTPLRQAVLTALWTAQRPLGAYDLRDQLAKEAGRQIAAPSIYRTLDFLCKHGVAARIESRNAYVACLHPEQDHACVFLVCDACGDAAEVENPQIEELINADARRLGFAVKHRVVELSGFCAPCQALS